MAYIDIAQMTDSGSLRKRLTACVSTEDATIAAGDPDGWVWSNRWVLCSAPGWAAQWASAVAANNPDPGADPAVITDAQILSQVQTVLG